ncbi:MAG TPA: hypothetical protein VMN57_12355 [Anaerolineales bacterium]|nr:hypothetical protein [Anaerolineales bacterium]
MRNALLACGIVFGVVVSLVLIGFFGISKIRSNGIDSFSNVVCSNLKDAGYFQEEPCLNTTYIPDAIRHYFPIHTATIDEVQAGFQTFKLSFSSAGISDGRSNNCPNGKEMVYLEYWIVTIPPTELFGLSFCDGILTKTNYKN